MVETTGKYPEAMYRVSLKVVIRNAANEVLVVKEDGSAWSLPGGGIDHGEPLPAALKRELYEEVLIKTRAEPTFLGIDTFYVENKERWQMWLVYKLAPEDGFTYGVGEDADEVAFMDPKLFKHSGARSEKLVYKWCVDQNATIE